MRCYQFFAILSCLLLPAASHAQVKLAWKLAAKDTFFVEESATVRQKLRARDEIFEHSYRHTKLSRFQVKAKNEDGSLVLEQEIIKVRSESTGRDSKADGGIRKLEGGKLLFTLDPGGRIAKMDGYDDLIGRLGAAGVPVVQQSLTPQALRTPVELLFAFVPDKEVAAGASWQTTSVFGFGPLGQFDCKNTCTLKDATPADKLKIDVLSAWQFVEAPREQLKQMKIAGVTVHKHKASGTLLFDSETGHALRCDVNYVVNGVIVIALPNVVDMEFEQHGDMVLQVMEKMPEKK